MITATSATSLYVFAMNLLILQGFYVTELFTLLGGEELQAKQKLDIVVDYGYGWPYLYGLPIRKGVCMYTRAMPKLEQGNQTLCKLTPWCTTVAFQKSANIFCLRMCV